jgi:hypothetical protein
MVDCGLGKIKLTREELAACNHVVQQEIGLPTARTQSVEDITIRIVPAPPPVIEGEFHA